VKQVEFDAQLLEQIRSLPKPQRLEIGNVISAAQRVFGSPHQHGGIGLRKLKSKHYEIRLGLGQRLIFEEKSRALYFKFLGNHNEVRRFLKGL